MDGRISRRDFMTLGLLRNLRSHPDASAAEIRRDNVVEKAGEAVALLAILRLAWTGSQERLKTYKVNSETRINDRTDAQELLRPADFMVQMTGTVASNLVQLEQVWTSAYHKTRLEPYTDFESFCDAQGKSCTTRPVTKYRTVSYWDEPPILTSQGFDHTYISILRGFFVNLSDKSKALLNEGPGAFDPSDGFRSVYYEQHDVDQEAQLNFALFLYSTIGAAFVFYEECAELAQKYSGNKNEPIIDEGRFIKRRTLLKLLAASTGALSIRSLQDLTSANNQRLIGEIRENTKRVVTQTDASNSEIFARIFNTTPQEIGVNLATSIQKFEAASISKQELFNLDFSGITDIVRLKIESTLQALRVSQGIYSETLQDGVSDELATLIRAVWATREIGNFVNSKSTLIDLHHLIDAGLLTVFLGASMAFSEMAILPTSEAVLDGVIEKH